ncbi:hypothetical protein Gohar_014836 [Gossypium harknessii]|uniref:peptidylprolyl isomerase n=1 Tax=Gossypium harknessii TaxID=34285 RepID=A0A7J9FYE5_9ROSI|nr:hypothetical protein [Gossypium harknessii]
MVRSGLTFCTHPATRSLNLVSGSNSLPLLRWGSTPPREVFEVLSSETPTWSFNNERYIVLQGRVYGTNLAKEKFLKCCLLGSQWILQQKALYQCTGFTEWKRLDWWRYNLQELRGEANCKYEIVHYRAWTETTKHKFDDTWHEQQPLELVLGKEKKEMTGLAIGVSSMKSGERALLHVGWELGYGKEGSFSFPNVPPMADILYEVELIGFDETKEGKARADMTVEERIGAADRRKMDGNSLFKEDKLEEAMQQYEMAIAYMGDDFMFQLFGKYRDMALAVKNPCHLNMAACLIKLKRYEEAIGHCSIIKVIKGEFGWAVRLPAVSVKTAVAVRLDIVAIL